MTAKGRTLQFLTGAGVFSKASLDEGSKILIEALEMPGRAKFCDLGCGWGAVGAFIGKIFPESSVYACDINARAAQLARWNLKTNKVTNSAVWCGDGLGATPAEFFDCIACNPPIRAGNATIEKLFADAQRGLKNGGALWVVIRTAQGAKSWQKKLAAQFGECETLQIKDGYRILRAVKSPPSE
jgi:16S rRNA (guanine1207-N2)-methyltransferase